jgi:hypothetical protein
MRLRKEISSNIVVSVEVVAMALMIIFSSRMQMKNS